MNILLICAGGMSTSIMVNKMKAAAANKGVEGDIWAVGEGSADANVDKADVILLGPQIRFRIEAVRKLAQGKPVEVMDMRLYGTMNGEKILDMAIALYEKNNC